ncbi:BTB/POZ domain-containing protein [Aspergillus affinis]|uniref:BTB/POZ domain-containing protein n=1 Tax=Aspergillus affinis TaxID=1070780 RepID=UPI0022FEF33C|nr:uncharacterized protein KD926_011180 [Aspergillus affinis]KAI9038241.1 hypothetical protein KD926_011180 [Aspergillus affinis]
MSQPQRAQNIYEETIDISDNAEMTLVVEEYEDWHGRKTKPVAEASPVFQNMLRKRWAEASKSTVTLQGDNVKAMEMWLRLFHATLKETEFWCLSIEVTWHLVMVSDKYDIDRTKMKTWFGSWFDFEIITRELAYNWEHHISEVNPTTDFRMRLPSRVIQQLKTAKGRLRTILHRGLFELICEIVDTGKCSCKERTVFNFLAELRRIQAWPLEDTMAKTSIETMLKRLKRFGSSRMNAHGPNTGMLLCKCSRNWGQVVYDTVRRVRNYFDGLCLDCMKSSKDVKYRRDGDIEYWGHHMSRKKYDAHCRIKHGEPTWWFSFMGRREKKELIADS